MRKSDLEQRDRLRAAVRQVADEYLSDPNITSVGIGYKQKDGERTKTLALQFTVGTKFAPEALERASTRPIPEQITANGITFETDVLERSFDQQATAVAVLEKSLRKQRVDPLQPGVSIAHVAETAGTLGCIVHDDATGQALLLSNWHVLHGATGSLGDSIVQPGPFDDNRIAENVCGVLLRSHLGLAGDCAVATIAGREASEVILDLGVPVRRLADPELDDLVVKSGRTTDVTYGRVTRIHAVTRLSYGAAGDHDIGSFEIGVDEGFAPPNGEISMGGDSGSAWMSAAPDGSATDQMVGLHFAGEAVEPSEYALACYAASVFKKLEISPLAEPLDGAASVRTGQIGYDPEFLPGSTVTQPAATTEDVAADLAPTLDGGSVRHYRHYSLAMSRARRFCRWAAWNIDGARIVKLPRTDDFRLDPLFDAQFQIGEELYTNNRLDRGHVARRADLVWGTLDEAAAANTESFYFTNIAPMLDDFNRTSLGGLWGGLEDAVFDAVEVAGLRMSAFGGPIFRESDPIHRGLRVPRSYWKAIAYVEGEALRSHAYVLTQDDLEAAIESLGLEEFRIYQVPFGELVSATSLSFGALVAADTMPAVPEAVGPTVRRISDWADVVAVRF